MYKIGVKHDPYLSLRSLFYREKRANTHKTIRGKLNTKYVIFTIKVMGIPIKRSLLITRVWKSFMKKDKNEDSMPKYGLKEKDRDMWGWRGRDMSLIVIEHYYIFFCS